MKTLKYLIIVCLTTLLISCDDETTLVEQIEATPNLASFVNTSANFSAVTDGKEYNKTVPMIVKGPSTGSLEGDVTVTVSADPKSTAKEGVHYKLSSNKVTLTKEGHYLASLQVTMLTNGIIAPLDENPVLILNVTKVDASGNVIANGKSLTISMLYLCYSDLSGTYLMTNTVCNNPQLVTISANPDGSWHASTADGGLLQFCSANTGLQNDGNFSEVCGVIAPSNDITYCGSNGIGCITGGTWDEGTGTLTLEHSDEFFSWSGGTYTSTYIRQ